MTEMRFAFPFSLTEIATLAISGVLDYAWLTRDKMGLVMHDDKQIVVNSIFIRERLPGCDLTIDVEWRHDRGDLTAWAFKEAE